MFNLAYMHEQGLGMKKDFFLAKRFYDLAAETNADAKIPVALALLKLQVLYKMDSFLSREDNFFKTLGLDENFSSNWDLYLITIITILLGMIIYSRRPPHEQQQQQASQQQEQQQQQSQNVSPNEPTSDNSEQQQQPTPPPANNSNESSLQNNDNSGVQ